MSENNTLVSLKELILSQKVMSEKFENLCKRPIASSEEEAEFWMKNHLEYLLQFY